MHIKMKTLDIIQSGFYANKEYITCLESSAGLSRTNAQIMGGI